MVRGKIQRRMRARCGGNISSYTYDTTCGGYLLSKSLSADGTFATFNCSMCGEYKWGGDGSGVTHWWNEYWQYYTHCQNTIQRIGHRCTKCGTEYNTAGKCIKGTKKKDYLEARLEGKR